MVVSASHITSDLWKAKHNTNTARAHPINMLPYFHAFSFFSQEDVLNTRDVQEAFDKFYECALQILNCFYPLHAITVTNRDPHFVTPYIKALLRKRNKLMRRSRVEAAESLSARTGQLITSLNKTAFLKCQRGKREMWNLVRSVTGKEQQKPGLTKSLTVKHLNEHFSAMSTDSKYKLPSPKHTVPKILNRLLNGVSSVCLTP